MGYETSYELRIQSDDNALRGKIRATIEKVAGYEDWWDSEDDNETITLTAKWYEHDRHMQQVSNKYPDVTFVLEGRGEDPEDVWRRTWKAGVCVRREVGSIVFEDEE